MAKRKRTWFICQHLEMIGREALTRYQKALGDFVHRRHGIYALYRGDRLYYVGLANNLRSRLSHHLRDRHAETWDRFSVYFTIHSDNMRELESLAIRIAAPRGNRQKGRLKHSQDLRPILMDKLWQVAEEGIVEVLGSPGKKSEHPPSPQQRHGRKPTMSTYGPRKLRWSYNGKNYHAYVKKNGAIRFRGKIYTSPSLAATAVTHRSMNGWRCWKYERAPGDWVYIDELRNKVRSR